MALSHKRTLLWLLPSQSVNHPNPSLFLMQDITISTFLGLLQSYFCSLCLNSWFAGPLLTCEGVCCHKICHFSLCTFALIQWDPGSIWSFHQTLYKYQKTQGVISEIFSVNIFWKWALQSQIYHSLTNMISLGFEEVTKVLYLKLQKLFPFWLE